jgi:hypothetical protein
MGTYMALMACALDRYKLLGPMQVIVLSETTMQMFVVPDQSIPLSSTPHPVYSLKKCSYNPFPYRNALNDLVAKGEAVGTVPVKCPREVSRSRPPRMFGVLAQNAQMYTRGRVLRLILIHFPWSHISQDSLYHALVGTHYPYRPATN